MKKYISAFLLAAGVVFSSQAQKMVAYGPEKVEPKKAISVEKLWNDMQKTKEQNDVTFEGEIAQVCTKAGCWISVKKPDGTTFRVRFKDHFTIPVETAAGTKAYLHGKAYYETISVEMLKHFAEDAGKSEEEIAKITEPQYEFAFQADGITFEKPKK
ncbi:MAG: hypothetical protein K0R65_927 [Crocinitomicaceae bacterium]|jgi:hypothetical protein|nr:hypothetical protein [Crocinitomicaceae bacterium]